MFCSTTTIATTTSATTITSSLGTVIVEPNFYDHLHLYLHVSSQVQYPDDYQNLSYEDLKEFKQTRYAVADVLTDAASVLSGGTTLQILYMKLVEPGNRGF
ncbi:hypothetical protein GOBAR_AA32611 [Gossypium barbadense]|uniref:Uncharacterized protein n=1 Tax=Gossypium barbadense TaxID=3634 RepID=A0A2P5WAH9_GOSBA|nr:hypothetical protein GOBAR_AA32611 [Gossypium barbadense]